MKFIKSALQLKKFRLLRLNFDLSTPPEGETSAQELFKDYEIDIDMAWRKTTISDAVYCKINVNNTNNIKAGYSIFAEGIGFFDITNESISDEQRQSFLRYSAPSIVIQELRSLIKSLTSSAPLGSYLLPTLNITEQVKLKIQDVKKPQRKLVVKKKASVKKRHI